MSKTVTKISVARLVTGVYNLVGKCFLVSKCSGFNSPQGAANSFQMKISGEIAFLCIISRESADSLCRDGANISQNSSEFLNAITWPTCASIHNKNLKAGKIDGLHMLNPSFSIIYSSGLAQVLNLVFVPDSFLFPRGVPLTNRIIVELYNSMMLTLPFS